MPISVCPSCHGKVRASTALFGKEVKCPKCTAVFVLTRAAKANGAHPEPAFDEEAYYAAALAEIQQAPSATAADKPAGAEETGLEVYSATQATQPGDAWCDDVLERYARWIGFAGYAVLGLGLGFAAAAPVAGLLTERLVPGVVVGVLCAAVGGLGCLALRTTGVLLLLGLDIARSLRALSGRPSAPVVAEPVAAPVALAPP